jgi:prepilin-type N-terminal cleavage/methylation domain-containing protein
MDNDIIIEESTKKDRGFTLIELLIVIVILGILATVTVFAVRGITNRGQDSACSADFKTIEVAIEAYSAQYGGYPANTQAVVDAGFLRANSTPYYQVGTNGAVTPTAKGTADC